MPRANLPLAFGELLVGALVIEAAIKGASIGDVIRGNAKQAGITGLGSSATATVNSGQAAGGAPFSKNATSSRLDQGQDVTSEMFNAPVSGTIVAADQSNAGWAGGGAVAIKMDSAIKGLGSDVLYFTEGLAPTVKVGQHVNQGDQIAIPAVNPYNGVIGNIEWGLANPRSPTQPLAHVASDPVGAVQAFYKWALSIGAPKASQTGLAGHA